MRASENLLEKRVVAHVFGRHVLQILASGDDLIAPLAHVAIFVGEQLKGGAICGGDGGNGSLAQAVIGLPLEAGHPGIGDGDGILNRRGDSDLPFPDGRYRLNRGGEKLLRKTRRRGLAGCAGCGGGDNQGDLVVLEGDSAICNLSQSFNVDIGAAIDLDDAGFARLNIDDEHLGMWLRLRGNEDRQGKNNWQSKPWIEGPSSHRGVSYEDFVSVTALRPSSRPGKRRAIILASGRTFDAVTRFADSSKQCENAYL